MGTPVNKVRKISKKNRSSSSRKLGVISVGVVAIVVASRSFVGICLDTPIGKLIPEQVTAALMLIGLAIAAAPYLAGQDLGPLKVPDVSAETARNLRIVGPLLAIVVVIILLVPLRIILLQDCDPLRNGSAEKGRVSWNTDAISSLRYLF